MTNKFSFIWLARSGSSMDSQSQEEAMTEKEAKRKEDSLCVGDVCCVGVGKSPYSKQKPKCILSSFLLTKNAL